VATLGRTTLGNSGRTVDTGAAKAFRVGQMPAAGVISAISLGAQGFIGAVNAVLGVYTGDVDTPIGNALGTGSVSYAAGAESIQSVTGLSVSVSSGDYIWLVALAQSGAGGLRVSMDSATSGFFWAEKSAQTYPTLPAPWGVSSFENTEEQYTAFATYSTGVAPSLTDGPNLSAISASGFDVGGTADAACEVSYLIVDIGAAASADAEYDASVDKFNVTANTPFSDHHNG